MSFGIKSSTERQHEINLLVGLVEEIDANILAGNENNSCLELLNRSVCACLGECRWDVFERALDLTHDSPHLKNAIEYYFVYTRKEIAQKRREMARPE